MVRCESKYNYYHQTMSYFMFVQLVPQTNKTMKFIKALTFIFLQYINSLKSKIVNT